MKSLNRRNFIKTAVSALALPSIIPSSALGLDGAVAPSNRINLGLIGTGNRMTCVWSELSRCRGVQGIALCDVQKGRRDMFQNIMHLNKKNCYEDYRDLVVRPDIDAVVIATPDHNHVHISIAAMKEGKDVFCEKPLSNTIREGRALVNVAERYGAVFQHGTLLHSLPGAHLACELVRNGRLGNVKEIRIGSPAGYSFGWVEPAPVPPGLNYDLWLGPAPYTPYNPVKVGPTPGTGLPAWYFYSDYSKAGWIAGYGVHDLDLAQWAIGMERSGPVSIEGHATFPRDGIFDTPLTFEIVYEYANGIRITMTDTSKNRHGVTFFGENGKWIWTRGGVEANPPSLLRETIGPKEIHLYKSPGHGQNFIDCIRSRAETITPAEIAHRSTSLALLGNIACKLQRKLRWDPAREIFPNDSEANGLLQCTMRAPFQV